MRPPGALFVLKLFVFLAKAAPLHTSSKDIIAYLANKRKHYIPLTLAIVVNVCLNNIVQKHTRILRQKAGAYLLVNSLLRRTIGRAVDLTIISIR